MNGYTQDSDALLKPSLLDEHLEHRVTEAVAQGGDVADRKEAGHRLENTPPDGRTP